MDADRFDTATRTLAIFGSRRRALGGLLAGALGVLGWQDPEETQAHDALPACKKKSGKAKKKCIKKAKAHNATHTVAPPTGGGGGGGDTEQCPGVDLKTDVNNCGTCGKVCEFPNARAICAQGTCEVRECTPGFVDCNPAAAGCETQLGTDDNCQNCGDVCDVGEHCGGIQVGCLPNTETNCSDGRDNDGDGNVDGADPDCPPGLQSVTVDPNPVHLPGNGIGTVQLNRPAVADTMVTLSVDKPANANVDGNPTVSAGQTSATFVVTPVSPTGGDPVTLTAALNLQTVTVQFEVVSP